MFNIPPVRAQVAVMYFMAQSCLHTVVNLNPTKIRHISMAFVLLSPFITKLHNIPRKCRNSVARQIMRLGSKVHIPQKILVPTYHD